MLTGVVVAALIFVLFDNVITAGVSTAAQLPVGPALPSGYSVITSNGSTAYFSVSTTATFDGFVDVTIDYAEGTVPAELEFRPQKRHARECLFKRFPAVTDFHHQKPAGI